MDVKPQVLSSVGGGAMGGGDSNTGTVKRESPPEAGQRRRGVCVCALGVNWTLRSSGPGSPARKRGAGTAKMKPH